MIGDRPVMPIPLGILGRVPQDILVLHAAVDLVPAAEVTTLLLQGDVATHLLQGSVATRLLQGRGSTPGRFHLMISRSTGNDLTLILLYTTDRGAGAPMRKNKVSYLAL